MKKNNKWVSLPLAMGLVMIMSLLAIAILEYIVPFSREIKWIENSSNAYYQANSWIEEWLYYVYIRNNSWTLFDTLEDSKGYDSWDLITYKYNTSSSWNTLPPPWEGNSEYDSPDFEWNIISSWNPIQLSVWNWYIDTSVDDIIIKFRIPDLNLNWNNDDLTLSWSTLSLPIVNWQLSSSNNTLNASWSIIKANQIDWSEIILNDLQWVDLNWNETNSEKVENFYDTNCLWLSLCTLKFSVVNKLESDDLFDPVTIPYLEWQLNTWDSIIPLRYTKIESSGKSYWYKKDLEVKVAWPTVNEAFDFTVFQ